MNPNEFSIHDWQFKFNNSMILNENTDEILYIIQKHKKKEELVMIQLLLLENG